MCAAEAVPHGPHQACIVVFLYRSPVYLYIQCSRDSKATSVETQLDSSNLCHVTRHVSPSRKRHVSFVRGGVMVVMMLWESRALPSLHESPSPHTRARAANPSLDKLPLRRRVPRARPRENMYQATLWSIFAVVKSNLRQSNSGRLTTCSAGLPKASTFPPLPERPDPFTEVFFRDENASWPSLTLIFCSLPCLL